MPWTMQPAVLDPPLAQACGLMRAEPVRRPGTVSDPRKQHEGPVDLDIEQPLRPNVGNGSRPRPTDRLR